jgi:hypothetical protein
MNENLSGAIFAQRVTVNAPRERFLVDAQR